jgi:hypothetical protein
MLLRNYTPRRCRKKPKARARSRRLRAACGSSNGIFGFGVAQQFTSQTCGNREANAGLLGRLDGADRPANHSEA